MGLGWVLIPLGFQFRYKPIYLVYDRIMLLAYKSQNQGKVNVNFFFLEKF